MLSLQGKRERERERERERVNLTPQHCSRAGFLDWLIGRQGENWTVNQRFIREYAGLSVQGLIWTAPQGYLLEHLGFGWEYSLSGSLMGLVYYVGAQVNITSLKSTFLDCNVALSELFWGSYVWFVLSTVSLSQLVRRAHCTIHKRNPYLDYKPFSKWEVLKYESLNRTPFRVAYELFILLLNLLYCCSLIFYELVEQREIQNKGQVFFGLFTAILCLTFTQGWSWSTRYLHWKLKRITKAIQRSNFNASQTTSSVSSPPPPGNSTQKTNLRGGQLTRERNKNEALQKAAARAKGFKDYGAMINESEPLLTWPYSHPDRLSPTNDRDTASGRNNRLQLPEGELEHETMTHNNIQRASASMAILVLWQNIEKWVWMDIFVWIRRLFGIISLLNVLLLIVMVVTATVQGWDSPRFMQQCGKA